MEKRVADHLDNHNFFAEQLFAVDCNFENVSAGRLPLSRCRHAEALEIMLPHEIRRAFDHCFDIEWPLQVPHAVGNEYRAVRSLVYEVPVLPRNGIEARREAEGRLLYALDRHTIVDEGVQRARQRGKRARRKLVSA